MYIYMRLVLTEGEIYKWFKLLARKVGERDVLERSLEVTKVLRDGERRWCKHEAGLHIFGRKIWI